MFGAIIGDIVGSRFEWNNNKTKDFDFFTEKCYMTDDSVMTLAIAKAILKWKELMDIKAEIEDLDKDRLFDTSDYEELSKQAVICMQELGRKYPRAGYGGGFHSWLMSDTPRPYNSWGNGSAMRVSPCGLVANSLEEAVMLANAVTRVTHNHPEGLKGAYATATAVYLAKSGHSKKEIEEYVSKQYYDLNFDLDELRPSYEFDVSCQGSVPQAIRCFLDSTDFEDAIRLAISLGGDSDTIGAICGGIAGAFYGIDEALVQKTCEYIGEEKEIIEKFEKMYL